MSEYIQQLGQQQFLSLITHFYCSLTGKKDMQNISTQIRDFVMLRHDIKNKQQAAKRILDFLLNLQSKLTSKSDQAWDCAFQLLTARAEALLKICSFPLRHACSVAFQKLSLSERLHTENHTIMMNIQTQEDEINIEVEEEIKKKTFYFFKWCQFVDQSKAMKQMKKRQINNRKLSLSFNKYGVKSSYFNGWKTFWKKSKLERQRSKIIDDRRKTQLKQNYIRIIEEVAAIISVEQGLSVKIAEKILELRKREVYKKLKCNRKMIKGQTAKCKKAVNSYAYLFIQTFTNKLKPLMNKSYQVARSRIGEEATASLALKYFNYFKKLSVATYEQIATARLLRKKTFLKNWNRCFKSNQSFVNQYRALDSYLKLHRRRNALTVISFNKMLRCEQYKKIDVFVKNFGDSLNKKSLNQMNIKRQLEDKQKLLTKIQMQKRSRSFVSALQRQKNVIQQRREQKKNIQQLVLKNWMHRYYMMKIKLEEDFKYYESLRVRHQDSILASAFKRWKKLKLFRRYEQSAIDTVNRVNKNLIMRIFWKRLTFRATERTRLQKFILENEHVFKKLAFSKLAKKSIVINQEVQGMIKKKNRKLIQNLFSLLKENQQYNYKASLKIHTRYAKQSQKMLIKALKQIKVQANKNNQLRLYLDKSRIRFFLAQLKKKTNQTRLISLKYQTVSKKAFVTYFRKSAILGSTLKEKMAKKEEDLEMRLEELAKVKFISGLKNFIQQESSMRIKQEKIQQNLLQSCISKIKNYIKTIKKTALLKSKTEAIETKRASDCIRVLMLRKKEKKLCQILHFSKKQRSIIESAKLIQNKLKSQISMNKLSTVLGEKLKKQFFSCLWADKRIADEKYNKLLILREKKENEKISSLYKILNEKKMYSEAKEKLAETRRKILLSEFIATSLRIKFNKIKFHTSLKFYARHILSKAFRSLRHAHVKIKQKENMIKLDRTSSIMVEKSIQKSFKSNTLSEQIEKFNLRKSRLIR